MNFVQTVGVTVLLAWSTLAQGEVVELAPGDFNASLVGINNTELNELIGTSISDIFQDFTIYAQGKGIGAGEEILYQGTLMTRVV